MWPKAITTLIELAPHITRLVPMADRFFSSKSAESEASLTAMQQMAEGLRGDLGQVTASHAGLYRQLNDQSEKLSNIAAEQRSAKVVLELTDARLGLIEKRQRVLIVLLSITLLGILALMLLVITHHG
jgi:phage-related tail protein